MIAEKNSEITVAKEAIWLYDKFGEGEYTDIAGLCKLADIEIIKEKTIKAYRKRKSIHDINNKRHFGTKCIRY